MSYQGLTLEDGDSILHMDGNEVHRFANGWSWKFACKDGLKNLHPCHAEHSLTREDSGRTQASTHSSLFVFPTVKCLVYCHICHQKALSYQDGLLRLNQKMAAVCLQAHHGAFLNSKAYTGLTARRSRLHFPAPTAVDTQNPEFTGIMEVTAALGLKLDQSPSTMAA